MNSDAPREERTVLRSVAAAAPRWTFAVTLAFVVVEYVRPQDWLGPLDGLPIGLVVAIPLALAVATHCRPGLPRHPIPVCLALLVAIAACWVPFATNRFWAFETFSVLAVELVGLLAIASFANTPRRFERLLWLLLPLFAAQAAWAITHLGKGFTVHFGDENDLALGMCVALPFVWFGASTVRPALRPLLFGAGALLVAGVVASASRGGLVALVACCGAMLLATRRLLLGLGIGVLALLLLVALTSGEYWADMATMFDPSDSTRSERIRMWTNAAHAFAADPILGVGPGNIPWTIERYESVDTLTSNSIAGRAVHSLYLTLLAEWGVVGLALYGTAVASCLALCRRVLSAPEPEGFAAHTWIRATLCSLAALGAGGIFLSVLYYPHLYFLLAFALLIAHLQQRAGARRPAEAPPRATWARPLRTLAPFAALLLVLSGSGCSAGSDPHAPFTIRLDFEEGAPGSPPEGSDAFDELADLAAYTDAVAYRGGQAAALPIRKGSDGWKSFGGRRFFPEDRRVGNGSELWIRVRTYLPAGFDVHADPWLKFMRIHTGRDGEHEGYLDWYLDDPAQTDDVHLFISEVDPIDGGPATCGSREARMRHERWETWEMYVRLDPVPVRRGGEARVRMWKDGELLCEIDSIATLAHRESTADAFLFSTYWNGGAPKDQVMYLDDVVITTDPPLARDARGHRMIGMERATAVAAEERR